VRRADLIELCFITPIVNVPSILKRGILSHARARQLAEKPLSIAMQTIQDLREKVVVPGGRPLHDYANLYICARNPMMYKRKGLHASLCVLRVNPDVLDIPDTIIADGNASSGYARFEPALGGLTYVDQEATFAKRWTDDTPAAYYRKKSQKCAEVLVPNSVPPDRVMGAYVSGAAGQATLVALATRLEVVVNPDLFFQ
jgi:hypothetical protein